jgi:hypothetical protein
VAIGELLEPDEGSPLLAAWSAAASERLLLTRIIILGILSSSALLPLTSPDTAIANIKKAIRALLDASGMGFSVEADA